jgi:signal transduction histidine kinase
VNGEASGLPPGLAAVEDLARSTRGTSEAGELLGRICASVAGTFGFQRTGITRYLPDQQKLELLAAHGVSAEKVRRLSTSVDDWQVMADRVCLEPVHSASTRSWQRSSPEHAASVELDVPRELEAVTDLDAFDRMVSNLITNAFRYGEPPVKVSAEQRDRHFRLAIEDRGAGVSPEFVPHLFERFTRGDHANERAHGACLGLSIAQSFAHARGRRSHVLAGRAWRRTVRGRASASRSGRRLTRKPLHFTQ